METTEKNQGEKVSGLTQSERNKFLEALAVVQEYAYRINESRGWHNPVPTDAECVANCHGEISEINEWLRSGNPPDDKIPAYSGAEAEAADTVIRLMNWCKRRGWRLSEAILAKLDYNATRPHRHGGKNY
jgi:hypothetical protein